MRDGMVEEVTLPVTVPAIVPWTVCKEGFAGTDRQDATDEKKTGVVPEPAAVTTHALPDAPSEMRSAPAGVTWYPPTRKVPAGQATLADAENPGLARLFTV